MNEAKLIPYFIVDEHGFYFLKPLRPTGRYKFVNDYTECNVIYVEHRVFWFFTRWIRESDIVFRYEKTEEIITCGNKK